MSALASRAQLRMALVRRALVCVPLILLLGTLSGRLSGSGADNAWYEALEKPAFNPPGWVFALAWPTLYVLLGLALSIVLSARGARLKRRAVTLFAVQFALNLAWSPLFFAAHQPRLALFVLAAMLAAAIAATTLFFRVRRSAGLLMLPYLAWLCFAGVLNLQVVRLNPDAENLVPRGSSAQIPLD